MKLDVIEMFCFIDDFCKFIKAELAKRALESGVKIKKPTRIPGLTDSEIITIILLVHKSPMYKNLLLKKHSIIETVFGHLKEILMIEHRRHRSSTNMFIHVISTLIAYQLKSTKPNTSMLYAIK